MCIYKVFDSQIYRLAAQYTFSGGQIENLATKQEIDYVIDGEFPSFAQIQEYCDMETLNKQSPKAMEFMGNYCQVCDELLN